MKRTCKIILSIILVGCASIWLLDLIPFGNMAFLKFKLLAGSIGYLLALLASAIGAVVAIVFLMRSKYRSRGILYPSLTFVAAMLFFIFFLVIPVARGLKMKAQKFDFVSTKTKVVLFDPDSPGKGVTTLNTSAQATKSNGLTGNCTIKNLTADLNLASHITIEHDGHCVKITEYSVQHDSIPFYRDIHGDEDEGNSHISTSTFTAPTSTLIRINGEVMDLGEAADRFPRIPPKGTN